MTVAEREETQNGPQLRRPAKDGHRLKRSRKPTSAPAARFDPGRIAETRHRNPAWLLAGILLVVLCALGGVLLFSSADERAEVLVAAGDLEAGEPIERSDLRIARLSLDSDIGSLSPDAADEIVGQLPVGHVPAGSLLAQGMFAEEVALAPDEVVFGAALDPGEAPLSGVQIGAPVELLNVPKPNPGAEQANAKATPIGSGTVWAVEPIATGQLFISMRVPRDVGLAASAASQLDTLRVVLIGGAP